MTLYINACVREESRTDALARTLLRALGATYTERRLCEEPLKPLSRERLADRMARIAEGAFDDPIFAYAREFAAADVIVIAAPYWDSSFPALLKVYLENVYAVGVVSRYAADGTPQGLCRAQKLYYVTTAGGRFDPRFGYDYVRELCRVYFGIPETELVQAELLDIAGNDPEAILRAAERDVLARHCAG